MMLILAMPLTVYATGVWNRSFHNFSGVQLSADKEELLSLGGNFVLTPDPYDAAMFANDVYNPFDRKVHLAWHFRNTKPDDIPAKFRVPSKTNFHPSEDIEGYDPPKSLTDYLRSVHEAGLQSTRSDLKALHNLPRRLRKALNSLRFDDRLTFVGTDKNLGLACDLTSNYMRNGLADLSTTHRHLLIQRDEALVQHQTRC